MPLLSPMRGAALLDTMRGRRVLVLGDVMLDEFIWGRVGRISPEAPVPVVEVTGQSDHLGGAGNVAANVRSLGGEPALAGVIGRDDAGRRIEEALQRAGIASCLESSDSGRPTTVKTRVIAHNQQVVRTDREEKGDIPADAERALVASVRRELPSAEALVISDYEKGAVTASLLRKVLPLARRRRLPVFVDPKQRHFRRYRGVTLVTPNQIEAEQATGLPVRDEDDLVIAGRRILSLLGCRAALVTRGEHGMSLFERRRKPVHVPSATREVFDVTGAGDSVIATMALAVAAGATLPEAAALANCAAGVVVGKVGTAPATPDEVVAALRAGR
ncbi:MAG: D-glycero-beta-D-manno-heptose-7-phosphate kinase [Acidobacteria bacterium]|nr:D-glycero-beta-D-manno-heptose-7-phosphate kinase [Acidobacteriota bacterium]